MLVHTVRNEWQTYRAGIATKDMPSAGSLTYDAADTVTEREVKHMVDTLDAVVSPINVGLNSGINHLEIRTLHEADDDTTTMCIFAARAGDTSVAMIAEIAWVAGAQTNAAGEFFSAAATVTQYWNKTISKNAADPLDGIVTIEFDTRGYNRFWLLYDDIDSASTHYVTAQYSGY